MSETTDARISQKIDAADRPTNNPDSPCAPKDSSCPSCISLREDVAQARQARDEAVQRLEEFQADAAFKATMAYDPDAENLREALTEARRARDEALKDLKQWQRAAFSKPRTWEAIQSFIKAGDTRESIASGYELPVRFVDFLMFPECDLDARYGRPSDRTKSMRARAEAAEAELLTMRATAERQGAAIQVLIDKWRKEGREYAANDDPLRNSDVRGVLASCAGELLSTLLAQKGVE